jgi:hypothetical protein
VSARYRIEWFIAGRSGGDYPERWDGGKHDSIVECLTRGDAEDIAADMLDRIEPLDDGSMGVEYHIVDAFTDPTLAASEVQP